jgi:FKBP-type peptidyl-prolyl cis-trans isomerase
MTARSIAGLAVMLRSRACASPPPPSGARELPEAGAGVLYAIGASLGAPIKSYQLDEDEAREVARGMIDSARGQPYAGVLTPETAGLVVQFNELRLKELARREELAGARVLEDAEGEPGAVKTDSGMVLQVIEPGSGPSPTIYDHVRINYHGTLRDGKVFYSNRGAEPVRVELGTTSRCWQEALGSVAAGARLHVVCPPSLGFGWGGLPGVVPGGAVLTFDLELVSVEPTPQRRQ